MNDFGHKDNARRAKGMKKHTDICLTFAREQHFDAYFLPYSKVFAYLCVLKKTTRKYRDDEDTNY